MMGNGGYDKAFCLKLCATDYKGTEEDIAVNVFVIGFGLLHCLGAKKRKVTLKTYGMQSSWSLVNVKQANLESSSIFVLIL